MKRRTFIEGSAGIAAAGHMFAAGQGGTVHSVLRNSRLFDPVAPARREVIQDVISTGKIIICLHGDAKAKQWAVTATTPEGAKLWDYSLPTGLYSCLGTSDSGNAVFVHAFSYMDTGRARRNCILHLRPETGSSFETLGSTYSSRSTGRMLFAGDSFLLRLARTNLEIWSVHTEVRLETIATVEPRGVVHLDAITTNLAAITAMDGTTMSIVSIPDGTFRHFSLTAPEIAQAQSALQGILASAPPVEPPSARAPVCILAVTGANKDQGLLRALVLPVRIGQPTPLVTINSAGAVFSAGLYDVRHDLGPLKLIEVSSELGIVYADGSVGWHSVEA